MRWSREKPSRFRFADSPDISADSAVICMSDKSGTVWLLSDAEIVSRSATAANRIARVYRSAVALLDSAEMSRIAFRSALAAVAFASAMRADVIATHPRLLLTAAEKSRLLAKVNASDPSWQALKARADTLATYSINPYKFATRNAAPNGTMPETRQHRRRASLTLP